MQQFIKFCSVGALGFIVDSVAFVVFCSLLENMMMARLLSFWCAATATWLGNRLYTFKAYGLVPKLSQWRKHMLSVHLSGVLNLSVFYFTLNYAPTWVAFCLGTGIAICSNYLFAQRYVFLQITESLDEPFEPKVDVVELQTEQE